MDMRNRFAQARVLAGIAVVLVVLVAAIAVGLRMYPLSAVDAPADDRILFLAPALDDDDLDSWETGFDWEIHVMNSDGSVMDAISDIGLNADDIGYAQLTDNDAFDLSPDWSPDRKRIVFTSDRGNDVKSHDIYVMNADGSGVEQLTNGCRNRDPAWSPDGERIAFSSRGDIYVMNADGSDVVQLTGEPNESCAEIFAYEHEVWAVPGRDHAYYYRNEDGGVEPLTDSEYEELRPNLSYGNGHPVWSPDGERIAFLSSRNDSSGI
ncbi:MAG: hypothetical protein F4Y88_07775 [Chloroflexi bacterium]|nr:hypothetical protein [Chloroflexota bacterium]